MLPPEPPAGADASGPINGIPPRQLPGEEPERILRPARASVEGEGGEEGEGEGRKRRRRSSQGRIWKEGDRVDAWVDDG